MLISFGNASTGPNIITYSNSFTEQDKNKLLSTVDDKTLLLIDVDGIMLQGKLLINPMFRDFINEAQEKGAVFLPCSAMPTISEEQRNAFKQLKRDERGSFADSVLDSTQNPIAQRVADLQGAGFIFNKGLKEDSAMWPSLETKTDGKWQLEPNLPVLFRGFMATDLEDKGLMLRAIFKECKKQKGFQALANIRNVIAFDDQLPYLQGEADTCRKMGIHFEGILLRYESIYPSPDTPWGACPACKKQ